MTEPLTPAEIAELRADTSISKTYRGLERSTVLRLLDSHEALRQRADAAERAGMERAAGIADGIPNMMISMSGGHKRGLRGADVGRAIRAAMPAAAAKDEKGKHSCP